MNRFSAIGTHTINERLLRIRMHTEIYIWSIVLHAGARATGTAKRG